MKFPTNPATSLQIRTIERLGRVKGDDWVMRLTCQEANAVIKLLYMGYTRAECKDIHPGSVRDKTYEGAT